MAIKTFSVANVKLNGSAGQAVGNIESATLTITLDTGEITSLGDSWKEYLALGKSWSLALTAKYDDTDKGATSFRSSIVSSGTCVLTSVCMFENASAYFIGDTILASYSEGASVNAADTMSVTLTGNGVLTYQSA